MKLQLSKGDKITVFDSQKNELGEGTYLSHEIISDLNLVAYHCEEHTILAKAKHWLKVRGEIQMINV